ncbi:MAG: DUF4382 domain-containing protein [Candidatus Pacebacteria bacterium]|nr:DUF4382 domain-containing protein [Candidatus Paceibacterota bacterium]
MDKKATPWIIFVVIIVLLIGLFVWKSATPAKAEGHVVLAITDAATDMTNISEIAVTVSEVDLHSTTQGWVTASTETKTFNLLALKAAGQSALVNATDLSADTYDQVRVTITDVKVTTKDGVTTEAKLPSGEFKMDGQILVEAGKTSTVTLDFLADASLHLTGTGAFIFAPVINMRSASEANVEVSSDEKVKVTQSKETDNRKAGMDIDGSVKADFQVDQNAKLDVDTDGVIRVTGNATSTLHTTNKTTGNATSTIHANVNGNMNVSVPPLKVKIPGVTY